MKNVKKIIVSGVLAISLGLTLSGCKIGNIQGETSIASTESNTSAESTAEALVSSEDSSLTETEDESSVTTSEENSETGGGNPDNYTEIEITISESRYYYNNSEISLDELIDLFDGSDKNDTVNIHDDYASDKAFENLTSILKERDIPYTVD